MLINVRYSVTRLGNFWKFLARNVITKVQQIFGGFMGYFEAHHILSKNLCDHFLKLWKKIIPTSGLTGHMLFALG